MTAPRLHWRRIALASFVSLLVLVALALSVYAAFQYYELRKISRSLENRVAILEEGLKSATERLSSSSAENARLAGENSSLSTDLSSERMRNDGFQSQVDQMTGAVSTLTKLSQTDRELLMVYSKVYFLNENYVPSSLAAIPSSFVNDAAKTVQIHASVLPFLTQMFNAAAAEGIDLRVISAYRSFGEQAAVKSGYKLLYGSGANTFSADQGYSEHQLGSALDLTTLKLASLSVSFDQTKAYQWLTGHAYEYGFVLSYPKGNGYYQYEPWHWRFVGRALAAELHRRGVSLYNLPQRDINSYLVNIFD